MKHLVLLIVVSAAIDLMLCASTVAAPIIWDGPLTTFTKEIGSDPSDPANQDSITDTIKFTRSLYGQIYNIAQQSELPRYDPGLWSVAGTLWALGDLADWASLTFVEFGNVDDYGNMGRMVYSYGNPPVVVHLIDEDIYFQLNWNWWSVGNPNTAANLGAPWHDWENGEFAGFGYTRSTANPIPEPSTLVLFGVGFLGLVGYVIRRKRRK